MVSGRKKWMVSSAGRFQRDLDDSRYNQRARAARPNIARASVVCLSFDFAGKRLGPRSYSEVSDL